MRSSRFGDSQGRMGGSDGNACRTSHRATRLGGVLAAILLAGMIAPPRAPIPGPVSSWPTAFGPAPARAAETFDPAGLIAGARAGLKAGDYDQAARNLKTIINTAESTSPYLAQGYLLLVQTYVMRGNYYKTEPQGRETAELFYREARRFTEEGLRRPQLRHLRAEPSLEYPPEMVEIFRQARAELLGSLRIVRLEPVDAAVVLDGDTLRVNPADSTLDEHDLLAGPHRVTLHRRGFKDLSETLQISPGSVTERSYTLSHRHGPFWYASRSAVLLGSVAALVVSRSGRSDAGKTPATPLPGPPALPDR